MLAGSHNTRQALAYFYMVAAWGGYVFIINIIPIYVVVMVVAGRYSSRLYIAYSTFYALGSIMAMQVRTHGSDDFALAGKRQPTRRTKPPFPPPVRVAPLDLRYCGICAARTAVCRTGCLSRGMFRGFCAWPPGRLLHIFCFVFCVSLLLYLCSGAPRDSSLRRPPLWLLASVCHARELACDGVYPFDRCRSWALTW